LACGTYLNSGSVTRYVGIAIFGFVSAVVVICFSYPESIFVYRHANASHLVFCSASAIDPMLPGAVFLKCCDAIEVNIAPGALVSATPQLLFH
jgi:hypothetical protein